MGVRRVHAFAEASRKVFETVFILAPPDRERWNSRLPLSPVSFTTLKSEFSETSRTLRSPDNVMYPPKVGSVCIFSVLAKPGILGPCGRLLLLPRAISSPERKERAQSDFRTMACLQARM